MSGYKTAREKKMSKEESAKLRYMGFDIDEYCRVQRAVERFQRSENYSELALLINENQTNDGVRAHTYSICPQKGVKTDLVANAVIHKGTVNDALKCLIGAFNGISAVKDYGYYVSAVVCSGEIKLSYEPNNCI